MNVPDEEIVEEVLKGDRELFAVLVGRYQQPVYNLMFRYAKNEAEAADLTQDVFLRSFDSLWRFKAGSRFFPWLYTLALNRARDWHRKVNKKRDKIRDYAAGLSLHRELETDQQSDLEFREDADLVEKALSQLPPDTREILLLRYLHECSVREVAGVFKISESAAKMRIKRGIALLQDVIQSELSYEERLFQHGKN